MKCWTPATAKSWSAGATSFCAGPTRRPSGPSSDPALWRQAQAHYHRSRQGRRRVGVFHQDCPSAGRCTIETCAFTCRPTGFKHTGLFPEQAVELGLDGATHRASADARTMRVLNLFGYTGGATRGLRRGGRAGDATWTRPRAWCSGRGKTASCCGLPEDRVPLDHRRRAEVCAARERAAATLYDGILMDPPSLWARPGRRGLEAGKRALRPGRKPAPRRSSDDAAVLPDQQLHHGLSGQRC